MNNREIACILKFGFLLQYFNKNQIYNWADKKILQGCEDPILTDLLLIEGKSGGEVLSLLGSLIGEINEHDKRFTNQYFLGFFRELLNSATYGSQWIIVEKEVLRYYSIENFALDDDEKLFISILNNDFSLRENGLSGVMKMPDHLSNFLKPYIRFNELQGQLENDGISYPLLPSFS